jgi:hypothetical protein
MEKQNLEVLKSVSVWILLVMLPVGGYYWLIGDVMIYDIIHTKEGKALFFISLAAMAYAVMWTLQFHFEGSIFSSFKNQQYWNADVSWTNKWKNGDKTQGEKFFGSSTFFALLTDAFHLFQFIFLNSILFTIAIYIKFPVELAWYYNFIIIRLFFGTYFSCFFSRVLLKKE